MHTAEQAAPVAKAAAVAPVHLVQVEAAASFLEAAAVAAVAPLRQQVVRAA